MLPSMKMRAMDRGKIITIAPFAVVAILAIVVALGGYLVSPPAPRSAEQSASPAASPGARASSTPEPTQAPSPGPAATGTAQSNDAVEMLRVHNDLRTAVKAPAVRSDDRVTAAAQHHADYLARAGAIGHDESPGGAGFTGATVQDRLAAQGFAGATASEVAASSGSGTEDVRFLWDLPYHRLGLMHPHAAIAGWGHAEIGGHTATVGVLVFDFGAPAPDRVRSPAPGQRVSASWDGAESPDPLPTGAARPVGYPVMVVYANARAVDVRSVTLTDPAGSAVAIFAVPQIYERDYSAIVPAAPLATGTRYRVRFELSVAGTELVDEWEFETSAN